MSANLFLYIVDAGLRIKLTQKGFLMSVFYIRFFSHIFSPV